jgi:hypothetical protein
MRDNVGPHTDLLAELPYVGPPHQVRSRELGKAPTDVALQRIEPVRVAKSGVTANAS